MTPPPARSSAADRRSPSGLSDQDRRDLRYLATTLRRECLAMTSRAGSGHPTTAMSAADLVAVLFRRHLRYELERPSNPDNDRFVLSKGHGAPLLYAVWVAAGAIPAERTKDLRRFGSGIEGHPTPRFPWADVATGSLGQGLSVGVGLALAAKMDRRAFRTWVLLGDGETTEGMVWEAAALASQNRLGNLVALIDVNRLGQSQPTMLGHDVDAYVARFEAFGWRTRAIDGHDFGEIDAAFQSVDRDPDRPLAVVARTVKGKGVSFLEDDVDQHGKAVDPERLEEALAELSLDDDDRPEPVIELRAPEASDRDERRLEPIPPIEGPEYERGEEVATRTAYGSALAKLGRADPRFVAIDGDVMDSTRVSRFAEAVPERFVEGFIAEQNMVGMALGLQVVGKIPCVATFASFLTRALDVIRMAAISRARIVLCGTHAGVSIGEDGPSQMGLEDIAMMRAVPESIVLHPSDAVSAERLLPVAAAHERISYFRALRPEVPVIYASDEPFVLGGSKVLAQSSEDDVAIVAAGITVHEALRARELLAGRGIRARVIDLYSIKPLDQKTLLTALQETRAPLVTVEDHYAAGGIGEAVAASVSPFGGAVRSLAVREIPGSGKKGELLAASGIDAESIRSLVEEVVTEPRARAL